MAKMAKKTGAAQSRSKKMNNSFSKPKKESKKPVSKKFKDKELDSDYEEEKEAGLTFPRPFRGENGLKRHNEDSESPDEYEEVVDREGDVSVDFIRQVCEIKIDEKKWMVKVKFADRRFSDQWVERNMIRMVNPERLLEFYETNYPLRLT